MHCPLCASRLRRPAIILSLLLTTLFLAGCFGAGEDGADPDSTATIADGQAGSDSTKAKKPKKEKSIRVNTGQIRRGELVLPVYADGAIRTPKSVSIKTKVGGELVAVLVRDGDRVRKGQVIARIDPREYEITLEENRYRHLQALSQMAAEDDTFTVNEEAIAAFRAGRDDLDRLLKRGTITREEYQTRILTLEMKSLQAGAFRDAVFQQRTGLAEARMAEERAKLNLEYTGIRAPFVYRTGDDHGRR